MYQTPHKDYLLNLQQRHKVVDILSTFWIITLKV